MHVTDLKQKHVVHPAAPRQDIRVRVVLVVFDVKWIRHRALLFVAYGGVEKVCTKARETAWPQSLRA